jgi:hypothetical protein
MSPVDPNRPAALSEATRRRRQRLLVELQGRRLSAAYLRPDIRQDLTDEANDPSPGRLIDPEQLALLDALAAERQAVLRSAQFEAAVPEAFLSTDQVVVVPGLMGSELSDTTPGGRGLIWLSPAIAIRDRLSALTLAPYQDGVPERDLIPDAHVEATGVLPIAYALLRDSLELRRYTVAYHVFDWRKDVEPSARALAARLRGLAASARPIHLIAHSQGALVARRALRLLADGGETAVLDRVRHLVLLGPATYGSFSAALAVAGTHSLLDPLRQFTVEPAAGFQQVLASMSGLYQLLPFDPARVPSLATNPLGSAGFWQPHVPIDTDRLARFFGWVGPNIDTSFFDGKTTVILGDNSGVPTAGGVAFDGDRLLPSGDGLSGDGTVPHSCSVLPGTATYLARGTEHAKLALYPHVIGAVRAVLRGDDPAAESSRVRRVSDNPADYTAPVAAAAVAADVRLAAPAAPEAAAGPRAAAEPVAGFDQLVRAAAGVAVRDGVRIRVTVEVEPRP